MVSVYIPPTFEAVGNRTMVLYIPIDTSYPFLRRATLVQIHREHAPPRTSAKGRMDSVVIENYQIARIGL